MSDLSLTTVIVTAIRRLAALVALGLDDQTRYAQAQQVYCEIRDALPEQKMRELWRRARDARRDGRLDDPFMSLALFGVERDRRYRESPRGKRKRAEYMAGYRAANKAKNAAYMREYRRKRKEAANASSKI